LLVVTFLYAYSSFAATKTLCPSGCDYDDLSDGLFGINNTADSLVINGSGMYWVNSTSFYNISGMIEVSSDDVSLDFNGSTVFGDESNIGVWVNFSNNVTIQNSVLSNFSRAIYANYSSNLTIFNNTLIMYTNSSYAIYLRNITHSSVTFNNHTSIGVTTDVGVLLWYSQNGIINNNTQHGRTNIRSPVVSFSTNTTVIGNYLTSGGMQYTGWYYLGLDPIPMFRHNIYDNMLNGLPIVLVKDSPGTYLENNASINQLFLMDSDNSVFDNLTFGAEFGGLNLANSKNITLSNVEVDTENCVRVEFQNISESRFENISINMTAGYDTTCSQQAFWNYHGFSNNIIRNYSVYENDYGVTNFALYFYSLYLESTNNTFIDCSFVARNVSKLALLGSYVDGDPVMYLRFLNTRFINNGSYAIIIGEDVSLDFVDSYIEAPYGIDVHFDYTNAKAYFLNTTFNRGRVKTDSGISANYTVAWYLDVALNNTAGSALDGLNVSAYNSTGDMQFSAISVGGVARLNLTEYWSNMTHNFTMGNYTVNISGFGYEMQSFSVNMTENRRVNLTFECPLVVDYWWNVTSDLYCQHQTMTLNSNLTIASSANVVFDNVTLIMNSSGNVHNKLYSYGNLTVNNSNITAGNSSVDYIWRNEQPGHLVLENSIVSEVCGNASASWSIYNSLYVAADHSIIRNNDLLFDSDAGESGLGVKSASDVIIINNTIIVGSGSSGSLYLNYAKNATVDSNNITNTGNYSYGLYSLFSNGGLFTNNTISSVVWSAIRLYKSTNMTYVENNLWNNLSSTIIYLDGTTNSEFNHSIDTTNLANGYPILYYNGISDTVFENQVMSGQLIITQSTNITIRNITFDSNSTGIFFGKVNDSLVYDVAFKDAGDCMWAFRSENITFSDIFANITGFGAYILYSFYSNNLRLSDSSFNLTNSRYQRGISNINSLNFSMENSLIDSYSYLLFFEGTGGLTRLSGVDLITHTTDKLSSFVVANRPTVTELIDCSMLAPDITDMNISTTNASVSLINTSIDEDDILFHTTAFDSNYSVAWYLDVDVQDARGTKMPSVNISTYNSTDAFLKSTLTGSSGVGRLNLTRYWANISGKYYYDNYTINITSSYGTESYSINMSTNRRLNITMSCPSVVDYWWNVTSDIYCQHQTMTLNSNLTINESANVLFNNVTLIMNSSSGAHNGIWSFGNLTVNNSNVTAGNPDDDYLWKTKEPGKLILENSRVTECGYDFTDWFTGEESFLLQSNGSVIKNSFIESDDDQDYGVLIKNGFDNLLQNNTIISKTSFQIFIGGAHRTNITFNTLIGNGSTSPTYSIYIKNSESDLIANNTLVSPKSGLVFANASDVQFNGNTLYIGNGSAIIFYEFYDRIQNANHSFDAYNTMNDLPIYYRELQDQSLSNLDDVGTLMLGHSNNGVIDNITLVDNSSNIIMSHINNLTLTNVFSNDVFGNSFFYFVSNSTFENMVLNKFVFYASYNNKIENIRLTNLNNLSIPIATRMSSLLISGNEAELDLMPITNNTFTNITILGNYTTGIFNYYVGSSLESVNTYININMSILGTKGIWLSLSGHMGMIDSFISAPLGDDIWIQSSYNGLIYFLNTTFNESSVYYQSGAKGNYSVEWYLDLSVNDTEGAPIYGVNISAYNRTGQFIVSALSNTNGRVRLNLTNYRSNLTHRFDQSNYTINYTFGTFNGSYTTNMSTNRRLNLSLNMDLPELNNFTSDNRTSTIVGLTKEQLQSFNNFTLAKTTALVKWTGTLNIEGAKLDKSVTVVNASVSINTSSLNTTFNSPALLNFTGVDCSDYDIYYSSQFFENPLLTITSGIECPSAICTNVVCSGTTLTFSVPGFSSYAVGPENTTTPQTPGSSGSGGGGFSLNSETKYFRNVFANQLLTFDINNFRIAMTSLSFRSLKDFQTIKIYVRSYSTPPAQASGYSIDDPFQYLKVTHENYITNDEVIDIEMEFRVDNKTLGDKRATLYRLTDTGWKEQSTKETKIDGPYTYFISKVDGLSYFGIGLSSDAKVAEPIKTTEPIIPSAPITEEQKPKMTTEEKMSQPSSQTPTGQAISSTHHTTEPTPQTSDPTPEKSGFSLNSIGLIIAAVIVACVIIISSIAITRRKPDEAHHGTNVLIRQAFEGKPIPISVQNLITSTKAWMQMELSKGHTMDEIKKALKNQGWEDDLIDRMQ